MVPAKSLSFGLGKFGHNKNSARNEVPNLGLGPDWDLSPEMVPNKSQFCLQVPNFISKDVEKSRFRSRSRDFCQIFEGIGFGFGQFGLGKKSRFRKSLVTEKSLGFEKFGLGKKVSVSVSEKFSLGKKSRVRFWEIWSRKKSIGFGFGKIWSRKKVSVSVSENLVSEKKVSVSVSVKFLVSSFSDQHLLR